MKSTAKQIIKILEDAAIKYYIDMLDLSPGMVVIKDNCDIIVWANKGAVEEVGLGHRNRLIGKSPSDLLEFVPKDKYAKIDKEVIKSKESILNLIEIVNTPIAKEQIIRIDKIPFLDKETNECIGVVTYILNISASIEQNIKNYVSDIEYQDLRVCTQKIITAIKTSSEEVQCRRLAN